MCQCEHNTDDAKSSPLPSGSESVFENTFSIANREKLNLDLLGYVGVLFTLRRIIAGMDVDLAMVAMMACVIGVVVVVSSRDGGNQKGAGHKTVTPSAWWTQSLHHYRTTQSQSELWATQV